MNVLLVILIIIISVFIGITLANNCSKKPFVREFYDNLGQEERLPLVFPEGQYSNSSGFVPIETNSNTVLMNEDPQLSRIKQYDFTDNNIYERGLPSTINYHLADDKAENSIVTVGKILPYFNEIKFNQDYRDVLTSINDLVPAQKQVFNIGNIPLIDYSEQNPSSSVIMEMTSDFIDTLNETSKKNVNDFDGRAMDGYINYGWSDKLVEKTVESGWDKVQKSLGLQPSLYTKPSSYRPLKLVAIKKVIKFETDDEIKYVIYMILHKQGVMDQILLKVSTIIDKRIQRDENNFFNVNVTYQNDNDYTFKPNFNVEAVIEEIDVLGFFTEKFGTFKSEDFGIKYAKYDELTYNNMTSNKYIRKVLLDKYNKRNDDINRRNATLDDDGRIFHSTMSGVGDYCNLGLSATIFDDIDAPRLFC